MNITSLSIPPGLTKSGVKVKGNFPVMHSLLFRAKLTNWAEQISTIDLVNLYTAQARSQDRSWGGEGLPKSGPFGPKK